MQVGEIVLATQQISGVTVFSTNDQSIHFGMMQRQVKILLYKPKPTCILADLSYSAVDHKISILTPTESSIASAFSDEIVITEHNFGELPNKKEIRRRLGSRCLTPRQMLVAYGVATDHKTAISPLMFLHICPAMIYQLDSKDCVHNAPVMEGQEDDASISKSVVF